MTTRLIFCCQCGHEVHAVLTDGSQIYRHRPDLSGLPFWQCPDCRNYVGCHHKTRDRTRPLGVIPTPAIREKRRQLHAIIDPLWRGGGNRKQIYKAISQQLGIPEFHSGDIRTLEQADAAIEAARRIS